MSDAEYDKKYDKKEPPASARNQGLYSDESVKREQQFDRFLSFKACSTYFEKFTARLSSYYNVTKNGIQMNYKDTSSSASNHISTNINTSSNTTSSSTHSNAISNSNLNSSSNSNSNGCSNSCSINGPANHPTAANLTTNNNSNNLNRNITARRSSRSNLESPNDKALRMTRDQLSPTVDAQCLSPRPRPKERRCFLVSIIRNLFGSVFCKLNLICFYIITH